MDIMDGYQENAVFVSDLFNLNGGLETSFVFDSVVNGDSGFFINLVRLKMTDIPEFKLSYQKVNDFFCGIATLLSASDKKGDKFYRTAYEKFDFSEVNGINLGFSKSKYGSGFGEQLRKQVLDDAFDIIKKGSAYPEIFHLVSLFEEGIGPDRLSDMIATIILPDIEEYTRRINKKLQLTPENFNNIAFHHGIAINPYKNCDILLLPIDILQELPIAKCCDDIDRVVHENENIRKEINEEVGNQWYSWAAAQKKDYLKRWIFEDPEKCARIIDAYRKEIVPPVDISSDLDYYVASIFKKVIRDGISFKTASNNDISALQAAEEATNVFREWVENNKGWDVILSAPSNKREKVVQRLFHLGAKQYISVNNLDLSFEPDAGRGPADFKVSRGGDIVVGEIKLSSNQQYMHGYETQLEEYAIAEGTDKKIYVFVDIGHPIRKKTLCDKHRARISAGEKVPVLIVVNSVAKDAASIAPRN